MDVAVIGLGWWGENVVRQLRRSPSVRVVLAVDPDPERRARAERLGVPAAASLQAALAADGVDGVVLCTPHRLHAEQVVASARAGKHVFCEKPFTTTGAEAEAALAAVRAAGVGLGVGHERRFEPAIEELGELCRAGALGTLLAFEGNFSQDKFLALDPGNWRLSPTAAPVGPLSATGIHLVDLAVSLLGAPTEVWARCGTLATGFGNGDTLAVTMAFAGGATATINAILATPFLGRVCVIGSEGWMEIRDRRHPEDPAGWDVTLALRGREPEVRFVPPHPAVRENLERFAASIERGVAYPIADEEIVATVRAFEAITRSAASGAIERVAGPRPG